MWKNDLIREKKFMTPKPIKKKQLHYTYSPKSQKAKTIRNVIWSVNEYNMRHFS